MPYEIHMTDEFDRRFDKIDNSFQVRIENEIEQLKTNPYVGKPLGYKFLREKKSEGYRFYYLIYEEYSVVFLITISDKKDQQKVINTIKMLIPYYREEIKRRLNL